MRHSHEMTTQYVNDKQTVTVTCNGQEVGAIQQNKKGHWIPRYGLGVQSELPVMTEGIFETPQVAFEWIQKKHLEYYQ